MKQLEFKYNDGGRSAYYRASNVGDCVTRAVAIATGRDYKEVYNLFKKASKSSPREGVKISVCRKVIASLGGQWVSCMGIGTGCTTHLRVDEIPMQGRIIASVSKHLTAVIDGVINDTYDPSRDGTRCVYGFWKF